MHEMGDTSDKKAGRPSEQQKTLNETQQKNTPWFGFMLGHELRGEEG